jgi:hypothetical protein
MKSYALDYYNASQVNQRHWKDLDMHQSSSAIKQPETQSIFKKSRLLLNHGSKNSAGITPEINIGDKRFRMIVNT